LVACENAWACECVPLSSSDRLIKADVVFEGELIRTTRLPATSSYDLAYTFKVTKFVKGPFSAVVSIFADGGDCAAYFEPGFKYRVYANDSNGALVSGVCSGNEIIGAVPRQYVTYFEPQFDWERLFLNTLEICGLGVLLGSGVFFWRRYVAKLP